MPQKRRNACAIRRSKDGRSADMTGATEAEEKCLQTRRRSWRGTYYCEVHTSSFFFVPLVAYCLNLLSLVAVKSQKASKMFLFLATMFLFLEVHLSIAECGDGFISSQSSALSAKQPQTPCYNATKRENPSVYSASFRPSPCHTFAFLRGVPYSPAGSLCAVMLQLSGVSR